MTDLNRLQNEIIPAIERGYLKKNVSLGSDFVQITNHFYSLGANVLQIIVEKDNEIIKKVKENHPSFYIIGGGNIDSIRKAREFLNNQSDYIIIGRLFAQNPKLVKDYLKLFGKHLIVSVDDCKSWLAGNKNVSTTDFSMLLANNKVKNVIYVSDDTKLIGGINLLEFKKIRSIIKNSILIYSGGVSSLADISDLKDAKADSIIVGTALYNKIVNYADAKKVFSS